MSIDILFVMEILTYGIVSATGLIVNAHLLVNFVSKYKGSSEFNKLCLAKTIPNVFVCATFLFWCTPLSALNILPDQLPLLLSVLIGQINIGATYVSRPIIQMFMAINIWFSITFPLKKLKFRASSVTTISISFMVVLVTAYTIRRLIPLSCGLSYKPQLLIWTSEPTECSNYYGNLSTNSVLVMCVFSSCFTIATLVKLSLEKVNGLSSETMRNRRKKRIRFFIQSVCQDGLHLLDLFSWKVISILSAAYWFQFTTAKLPLLLLHALDGFVMFYFHPELYPKLIRNKKPNSIVVTAQSLTAN